MTLTAMIHGRDARDKASSRELREWAGERTAFANALKALAVKYRTVMREDDEVRWALETADEFLEKRKNELEEEAGPEA